MRFLVSAYGERTTDTKAEMVDNLKSAIELADAYVESGYEIEINPVVLKKSEGWTESYYELKETLAQYDDYNDFISNTTEADIKLYQNNGLIIYIQEYYKNSFVDVENSETYINIPISKKVYKNLEEKANRFDMNIIQYTSMILDCFGGEKNE